MGRCPYCRHLPLAQQEPPRPPRPTLRFTGRPAIVVGGAPGVLADVERARRLRPGAVIVGANEAGSIVGEIRHVYTLHPDLSDRYRERAPVEVHTAYERPGWERADHFWSDVPDYEAMTRGSSGWCAGLWAVHLLECSEAILCGVRLDLPAERHARGYRRHHTTGPDTAGWRGAAMRAWEMGLCHRMRSMSGWTAELLGRPR